MSLKDLATVGYQNWYTEFSYHERTPSNPMPGDAATVQNILETLAYLSLGQNIRIIHPDSL